MVRASNRIGASLVIVAMMVAATSVHATPTAGGVVVEEVASLIVDGAAPLRAGDRIKAYVAGAGATARRVPIRDALHWRTFEAGELMRAPVTVEFERGGAPSTARLADGWVALRVRSQQPGGTLDAADQDLLRAIAATDWPAAEAAYAQALAALTVDADAQTRALIALHGAQLAIARFQWQRGREILAPAIAALPESLLRVALMELDLKCTGPLREWRTSLATLQQALPLLEREAPHQLVHARIAGKLAQIDSFSDPKAALVRAQAAVDDARAACGRCEGSGWVLYNFGDVHWNLQRVVEAGTIYAESLAIAQAVTPGQLAVAHRLMRNATAMRRTGRPHLAEPLLREALALLQQLGAPESDASTAYNELGAVASQLGDLQAARGWYQQSLDASRRVAPNALDSAAPMHNLAQVAMAEGDYATADRLLLDATDVIERAGNGPNLALFLTTRAQLEIQRGNDELAETILERVRDLQTAVNPGAEILGTTYVELSKLYLRRQHPEQAAAAREKALAIFENLSEDDYVLAVPLAEFGRAALGLGDFAQAEAYFARSLELFQRHAADSLRSTIALQGAAETAFARHDRQRAQILVDKALQIRRRDAPDTAAVAQSLHLLGRIAKARERNVRARELFCEAAEVLDRASLRSGGDDLGETRFRAQYADVYHDCLVATVDAGDAAAALGVLERSRARGFRHALEQRRLHLPEPRQQRAVSALSTNALAYQRALDSANSPALDATTRAHARERVRALQDERAHLQRKFAAALPTLARAYLPQQDDVRELAASLPRDTGYVAYSIGTHDAVVIAARAGAPVIAKRLALTRDGLATRVRALRRLIDDPRAAADADFRRAADALYSDLLAPVGNYIATTQQLWISADGALHDLPFAALWQAQTQRYLIETHALAFIDALALAKAVRMSRRDATVPEDTTLLAVGDPQPGAVADAEIGRRLRGVRAEGSALPPLPAARREVQSLAQRYGAKAKLLLGADATEARVRAEAVAAGRIHFAVHAMFDPLRPLDSALVLHPGGSSDGDDGFLQVWEIFEGPRLRADLVVLSACDTAAGQVFAGEGLLGFSRAFAFAGARATVASLWPVDDDATAALMELFYAARDRNQTPQHALRSAMLARLRDAAAAGPGTTRAVGGLAARNDAHAHARHPYYWAAFQVYGE